MAPNITLSQHEQIECMITRGCENKEISTKVGCNVRSMQRTRTKFRRWGTAKPPLGRVGRCRKISPQILSTLIEHLTKEPELYQDEIAHFLYDKFHIVVATPTISRASA
jgi:transposase